MARIKKDYSQFKDYIKKNSNKHYTNIDLFRKFNLEQKKRGQKGIAKKTAFDLMREVQGSTKRKYEKKETNTKVNIPVVKDYTKEYGWKQTMKKILRDNYGYTKNFKAVIKVFFTAEFDIYSKHRNFGIFIPLQKNVSQISFGSIKKGMIQFFNNIYRKIIKKYAQNFAGQDVPIDEIISALHKSKSIEDMEERLSEYSIEIQSIEKEVMPKGMLNG